MIRLLNGIEDEKKKIDIHSTKILIKSLFNLQRTYGDWWLKAPSRLHEIQPQNLPKIPAHDFIVVLFEDYIIPDEIVIFETFNPGAVVRIWAYTIAKTWICLWENTDYSSQLTWLHKGARRFSPALKKLQIPTKYVKHELNSYCQKQKLYGSVFFRVIRLEFNHSRSDYFTEIDAVMLCGKSVDMQNAQQVLDYFEQHRNGK